MTQTLTPETQALIAETEATVTKELPPAYLQLTISRAVDSSGTVIPRRFTCMTIFNNREINATAGTIPAAHNLLLRQIRMFGYEPMWTAVNDLTSITPADEPDEQQETFAPVSLPETPTTEPDEPGEHEDPDFGLVVQFPTLDKSGWLTPMSDPLAYKRVYLAAWELALGHSVYSFSDLTMQAMNVRASVAAVMMSGDAGESIGISAKAVNPWALGTNGEREMCWVRVLRRTPDPTTKPFRVGSGEAREAYLTTLSGLPAFPEKHESARAWREKRAARRFVGTKNANNVAARNAREDKRGQAHSAGEAARTAAFTAGLDQDVAEIHYKWVYCATLRFLGEVHAEYERQLAADGITEEEIIEVVSQLKVAV